MAQSTFARSPHRTVVALVACAAVLVLSGQGCLTRKLPAPEPVTIEVWRTTDSQK